MSIGLKQDHMGGGPSGKYELLEMLMAFARGGGDVIILGFGHNGAPPCLLNDKFADILVDVVHNRCNLRSTYEVEQVELQGVPLTAVRVVPRLPDAQYPLDRDKLFVRAAAMDRLARHEGLARCSSR